MDSNILRLLPHNSIRILVVLVSNLLQQLQDHRVVPTYNNNFPTLHLRVPSIGISSTWHDLNISFLLQNQLLPYLTDRKVSKIFRNGYRMSHWYETSDRSSFPLSTSHTTKVWLSYRPVPVKNLKCVLPLDPSTYKLYALFPALKAKSNSNSSYLSKLQPCPIQN